MPGAERDVYAEQVGADGLSLLNAVWGDNALIWLREIPAVRILAGLDPEFHLER
jgi:hypothetical protein